MTDKDAPANAGAELDSSAAMVRAESDHLDATLRGLVIRLSTVPGLKLTVSYRQGKLRRLIGDLPYVNDLNRKTGEVEEIVVEVGSCSYLLRSGHGRIECRRELTGEREPTTEELSFSDWATMLFDAIARQNLVNHESMVALRHLVEQDRVH
jgi:hypothetical protein